MALPPTIPTSFVPHSTSAAVRQSRTEFSGALGFFAYGVLGIALALALGVFFYGRILTAAQESKDATLAKIEAEIDPTTIERFVQLRDRLNLGMDLLDGHVAFSNFFSLLGALLPTTVRFSSLHLSFDATGKARLEGSGVAKSFNALAAASASFAADGRVKDAIFSKIVVNAKDNSVSFVLTAALDPKLVTFSPSTYAPPVLNIDMGTATTTTP